MRNSIFFVLVVASLESGCGAKLPSLKPFKMEVQQGNVVTSKMLLQLRPGMTRAQVRYIMGTPLIVDSFRDNRWDYFYELRKQGVLVEKRRVILDFDQDSLVSVRGDVVPTADNPDVKALADVPTKKVDAEGHWTEKLKFWQSDAATATAAAEGAATTEAVAAAPVADATVREAASAVTPPPAADKAAEAPVAVATASSTPAASASATTEDEVVPYIPEGDYQQAQAPSAAEMVKGNGAETATPVEPAEAKQVTAKGVAPVNEVAPPVFEPSAAPVAAVVAEPEPVMPPAVAAAAVTSVAAVAAQAAQTPPASSMATSAADDEVIPYIPEGEYSSELASAAKPASTKVAPKAASPATAAAKASVAAVPAVSSKAALVPVAPVVAAPAVKPVESKVVEAKPAVKQAVPVALPTKAATAQDEDMPYIPEGEYQGPGPTLQQMVMGNDEDSGSQEVEAATQSITEKGVAPVAAAAAEPVFMAEQLPAEQVEEALPAAPASVKAPAAAATLKAGDALAVTRAPQPVAMAPASAPVAAVPASDADVDAAIAAWAQAWRGKDINAYLSAYAAEFVPEGLPSKKAWEAQRKQRLSPAQGAITLVLKNVQVQRNGNVATVQFVQKYATKSYSDEVLKTLQLKYASDQRWLITRERTSAATSAGSLANASVALPAEAAMAATQPVARAEVPAPASVATPVASVDAAVQSWAQAWRSKNVQAYLSAYAADFIPEGLPSRKVWESQRKQRLSAKQGDITLELSNVSVQQDGREATVTFQQKYASRVYRDEMVKQLQLRYEPAQQAWLIVREQSGSGATVPAAKKTITAPEGSAEHLDGVLEQIGF